MRYFKNKQADSQVHKENKEKSLGKFWKERVIRDHQYFRKAYNKMIIIKPVHECYKAIIKST